MHDTACPALELSPSIVSGQLNSERPACLARAERPGLRLSAIFETIMFLSAFVLLNMLFGDGTRFIDMALHPFWIIVLLVTVQYGPGEALTAALLAGAFLLIGNLPEQGLTETMYEYALRVSFLPFMWIVTALVLGGVRARQMEEKEELCERFALAESERDAVTQAYNAVKQSREQLELRLAEERCSIATVYNLTRSLEAVDPSMARAGIEKLVRTALNPAKFSFFRRDRGGFVLDASFGWDEKEQYKTRLEVSSLLAGQMLGGKKIISIAHEEDERALDGQGLLAGAVYDEKTGKLLGILKIEEMAFTDLGVRTHEILRIVCSWVARLCVMEQARPTAGEEKRVAEERREIRLEKKLRKAVSQSHLFSQSRFPRPLSESAV